MAFPDCTYCARQGLRVGGSSSTNSTLLSLTTVMSSRQEDRFIFTSYVTLPRHSADYQPLPTATTITYRPASLLPVGLAGHGENNRFGSSPDD